jgi:cell division inhibitor SulA
MTQPVMTYMSVGALVLMGSLAAAITTIPEITLAASRDVRRAARAGPLRPCVLRPMNHRALRTARAAGCVV